MVDIVKGLLEVDKAEKCFLPKALSHFTDIVQRENVVQARAFWPEPILLIAQLAISLHILRYSS